MKVVFAGQLYSYYSASTCLGRMRAVADAGHTVHEVDQCAFLGVSWPSRLWKKLAWGPPLEAYNRAIVRAVRATSPDVVWIDKGIFVRPSTLRKVRASGTGLRLLHYTPDPAFSVHHTRHYLPSIPLYDLHVTTKRYEMEKYRSHGAQSVLVQFPSFDPRAHHPVQPSPEERERFAADVVFVGSWGPGRERYLEPLAAANDIDLVIWGNQWDRCPSSRLRAKARGTGVAGRDYCLALSVPKIALGVLSPLVPDRSTTRTFEIPATGGFMLAERTEEHQELFLEGTHAEFFSSADELLTKVRHYLEHDEQRRAIAAAGHSHLMRSGHSAADRVAEILRHVEALPPGP